jgi:hypothetical protein
VYEDIIEYAEFENCSYLINECRKILKVSAVFLRCP